MKSIDAPLLILAISALYLPLTATAFNPSPPSRASNNAVITRRVSEPNSLFRSVVRAQSSSDDEEAAAPSTPSPPLKPSASGFRGTNQRPTDPLIASLTRLDDGPPSASAGDNVRTPLGDVSAEEFKKLAPVAGVAILGFVFSVVMTFQNLDELGSWFNVPEMKYTPTKVVEGECRGLCSSQDESLEGMRNFMEGLRKN